MGVQHFVGKYRDFVSQDVTVAVGIVELALHPSGLMVIDKANDVSGNEMHAGIKLQFRIRRNRCDWRNS